MLKEDLNFTYELEITQDNKFGSIDDNGNWNGLIGALVTDSYRTNICSCERENDIDFTVPFYDLVGTTILMKRTDVEYSMFKFLKVLEWPVWLCILGAYLFTSILLYVFDKFSPYSYTNNKEKYADEVEKRPILEHLNYRQRVRVERVCSYWKLASKQQAWKNVKKLKFTRKMLCLEKPWNDPEEHRKTEKLVEECNEMVDVYKRDLAFYISAFKDDNMPQSSLASSSDETWSIYKQAPSNPDIYKQPRAAETLGAFSAIIQRCGPYLTELHLQGIIADTRFGRYFPFMPHLKHLRIDKPLDKWHLQEIDKYYSSQLISLVIEVHDEKYYYDLKQIIFKSTKLECLKVANVAQLFEYDEQGSSRRL
uniref:Ionotropic glutamate receptor C-terminal domain-containing protein n=1 Tax=Ditylenchus dipsaci TaxID=166011 RepID=A0A915EJ00_9BILA